MTSNAKRATSPRARPGQGRRRTDSATRDLEALALRQAGLTFDSIASRMGYADRSGAQRAVDRALSNAKHEAASVAVALELGRLDAMLSGVYPAATSGDTGAIAAVLRIMERRAKYLSLDATTPPVDESTAMHEAISKLTQAETIERMAALHVEVARRLYRAVLDYAKTQSPSTIAPQWVYLARGALRDASLDALQAETADWDDDA